MGGFFFMSVREIFCNRLVVLLLLTGMLAVAIGFVSFTAEQSIRLVIYGGYWAMLVMSTLFVFSLLGLGRRAVNWNGWCQVPGWPVWLIAACGLVLLVHERYGFKILMDEVMLLGTSMTMHLEKAALVPMRGNDIHGAFQLLNGELDKRPLFHPFLVSVLHDFTGYRPENPFILNSVLTFVLLGLVFHVGRKIGGNVAGALGVLLLTGLPLLAQNATGGGFELLNLVMILATLVLAIRHAEHRTLETQTPLILGVVLLAHTRYESVLFIFPVIILIVWIWYREGRPLLDVPTALSPLLLVPYALHHRVFSSRASSWELGSQPGYETPFSFAYVGDNLAHALRFFFSTTGEESNSLVIAFLGFVAVPFFTLSAAKILKGLRTAPPEKIGLVIMGLGFAAHTLLLMCYFWGRFDDPVIRRLSLPLNLALVLAIVAVAAEFEKTWVWRSLLAISAIGLFGHSLPAMARHDYTLDYYIGREAEWKRDFIRAHPERDYLMIDNSSILWVTHKVSSTPVVQARLRKEHLEFNFRNRTFAAMFVFQSFDVDPNTGALSLQPDEDLGSAYQLETVWERRFTPLRVSRISRITKISPGAAEVLEKSPPPPIERLSAAEREKIRKAYFERFIQRLP